MKRRNFIKLTATASAIGLLPNQISNALDLGEKFINCDKGRKKKKQQNKNQIQKKKQHQKKRMMKN